MIRIEGCEKCDWIEYQVAGEWLSRRMLCRPCSDCSLKCKIEMEKVDELKRANDLLERAKSEGTKD